LDSPAKFDNAGAFVRWPVCLVLPVGFGLSRFKAFPKSIKLKKKTMAGREKADRGRSISLLLIRLEAAAMIDFRDTHMAPLMFCAR